MKVKLLILTSIVATSLTTVGQINDIINSSKNTILTNSTSILNVAKTNTTAANIITQTESILSGTTTPKLTNDEVIKGLKEALTIGTNNSSNIASKTDGFLKNTRLFIPWPPEAKEMKAKLIKMGMQKNITEFETSLNRAAEEAAKNSAPIFKDAITGMSIGDGFAILNGNDSAATTYLKEKTTAPLKEKFMPVVKEAIAKVNVTSYWKPLATAYNKLPGVKKQNPNLDDYVCTKAISGLMLLIQDEEVKIRKNPLAQVTDLLKRVFGTKKQ